MNIARGAVLSLLLVATGCQNDIFSEKGSLRSQGDWRNTWQSHPEGCKRDPFDGSPVAQSRSIATLLWAHPGLRNSKLTNPRFSPDGPLRLELQPDGAGQPGDVVATLHTTQKGGILLNKAACSTLKLETQEQPADHIGGRPTLSGEVQLDCRANGNHITGTIKFQRCEY